MATKPKFIPCVPPPDHGIDPLELARVAAAENPANAPHMEALAALTMTALVVPGESPLPQFIAVMTTKYWGAAQRTLGVSFLDNPNAACRRLILQHMNRWNERCGLSFAESARGEVRIDRGSGGYWSFLGTDILSIPAGQPTMNLQGFTQNTPESEYTRVVCHETGHTAGAPHEHMRRQIVTRIDPAKAIAYFRKTQGWSPQMITEQVLTPIEESALMATPSAEEDSIMAYQIPGSITRDGRPIVGGTDITEGDFAFMAKLYPKADVVTPPSPPTPPPIRPNPPPPPASGRVPLLVETAAVMEALRGLGYTITR